MQSKDIEVFVISHDTDYIDALRARNAKIGANIKYVLVGQHEKQVADDLLVTCRLPKNIEQHNRCMCQYTGWWALAENDIPKSDYIVLLEYDGIIQPNFLQLMNGVKDLPIYGFIKWCDWKDLMAPQYGGIAAFAQDVGADLSPRADWVATSNVCLKRDFFLEMIRSELFKKAVERFKNDRMASHVFERFLTLYELSVGAQHGYVLGAVNHMMMDSHETIGFGNTKDMILARLASV